MSPNPISVGRCTLCAPPQEWTFQFVVRVDESAGLGGNVDFINITIVGVPGGFAGPPLNLGASFIISKALTNHVGANSSLAIPLGIDYGTGIVGSREAIMTVSVQFTDDRRNVFNKVVVVPLH